MFTTVISNSPDGITGSGGLFRPRGVVIDGAGRLWVVDHDNNRIIGFDDPLGSPPNSVIADRVLGKALFIDAFANQPTANRMNNPFGVAVDKSHTPNRLWVADLGNSRVLGFASSAAIENNVSADIVLGQPDFVRGSPRGGLNGPLANATNAVTSNSAFANPSSVAVDSAGGVYVADTSNSRVLKFTDPFDTDRTGDQVFGQTSFTTINPNFPYGTATGLVGPTGVSIDPSDNLWVADQKNHRVVRFNNAPAKPATGAAADLIIGQAGFVSAGTFPAYSPGCTQNRLTRRADASTSPTPRITACWSSRRRSATA
jgi:sugar lactone lactonase YvrE